MFKNPYEPGGYKYDEVYDAYLSASKNTGEWCSLYHKMKRASWNWQCAFYMSTCCWLGTLIGVLILYFWGNGNGH